MEEVFNVTVVSTRHVPHGILNIEDNVVVAMCLTRHANHETRQAIHEMPAQEEFVAARRGLHEIHRP